MVASMKVTSSGMLCHVVLYKLTDNSEVLSASIIRVIIILMKEAASSC
jgi:hypothetical protein